MRVPVDMRNCVFALALLLVLGAHADTRTITVQGTLSNAAALKGEFMAINISAASYLFPASSADMVTGVFAGELECAVIRLAHGDWVDISFIAFGTTRLDQPTMVIRVPYARTIDLGTFEWMPSHYRFTMNALVIDTAVPRDTVVADPEHGTRLFLRPVNPAPQDSVVIEFEWPTSGEPHVAGYEMYMKDCCTVLIDFTFAVRTDVDVYGDSWAQRAKPFALPKLEAGRYRLRQAPAQGEHLRDVDFLLGKDLYFTAGERTEP